MMKQVWTIGMKLEDAEKNIIESALQFFHYNKTMAADSLGISVRGLDHKMQKMQIENKKGLKVDERKDLKPNKRKSEDRTEDRTDDSDAF